jgi:hypothetical protein
LRARDEAAGRIAQLQRAMQLIADAVEDLPAECRDLAGFSRLADLLARGLQPPIANAISLNAFDA